METKAEFVREQMGATATPRPLSDAERVLVLERQLAEAKELLWFLATAGYRKVVERYRGVAREKGRQVAPPELLTYFGAVRNLCADAALSITVPRKASAVHSEYLIAGSRVDPDAPSQDIWSVINVEAFPD